LAEEEESDYAQNTLSSYRPFSVILYSRVKKLNLFFADSDDDFLCSLANFYTENIHNIQNERSLNNLKDLINQFPLTPKLFKLIKHYNQTVKEMIFFKLVIDIMENFYKKTEQPIFTKLRGQVLPLAINFYTSINELVIQNINRIIKLHVNESNC